MGMVGDYTLSLFCDRCSNSALTGRASFHASSRREAKIIAREYGWSIRKGRCLCPACSAGTASEPTETVWVANDGEAIHVHHMSDVYLTNTIRLLRRRANKLRESTPYPDFNGEMAQVDAENHYEALMDAHVDEVAASMFATFPAMVEEASRRNLPVYFE